MARAIRRASPLALSRLRLRAAIAYVNETAGAAAIATLQLALSSAFNSSADDLQDEMHQAAPRRGDVEPALSPISRRRAPRAILSRLAIGRLINMEMRFLR